MRSWRTVVAGAAVVAASTVVAACGGGGGDTPAAPSDPVLAQGQTLYNSNCASCHGRGGGGGLGPKLSGVVAERYPNIEDQEAVIVNGRGSMPAFGGRLSPEQIEAVARYTREVL